MQNNTTINQIQTGNRQFGPLPPYFDPSLLPKLDCTQIAWWDECHIEQQGGKVGNRQYQYIFKRDENGNISENGTYREDNLLTKASFKYPEQARFGFGVAKVKKLGEDAPVGVRMPAINYTGRQIVTIEVYEKKIREEIKRVKELTGGSISTWVHDPRPKDELWKEDCVSMLPGVGKKERYAD